ncbi:hypothetical protein CROQUDRAFT_109729 [Cronartium quercuum f. sp. fusiforme G11]|uniref:Uncharacterized protein n=1 Tax=Cronartium quercuum f. sp. fusiforme G11 TaxID=708437 RepID=A0A9P6NEF7_9BASI|nr:hypothetical protein CROQUDRAFT_109729 [Cronartium quercuum f. sp. fusiforme G11]
MTTDFTAKRSRKYEIIRAFTPGKSGTLAYSGTSSQTLGAGPICSRCFKITLILAHTATPPFILADRPDKPTPSVMVKILSRTVHFDLALPSPALNLSFFPLDVALYGYDDFGIWDVQYQSISCEHWDGWKNGRLPQSFNYDRDTAPYDTTLAEPRQAHHPSAQLVG